MAKLILSGATSGSISLESPAVSGTTTLTLPTTSGTVITTASTFAGTGPAFSALGTTNQNITNITWTKLVFALEQFDTANCFDSTTNYRFTPNVAGYYQIQGSVYLQGGASGQLAARIYKNGSGFVAGNFTPASTADIGSFAAGLIYMNGTTDYVELYVFQNSGSTRATFGDSVTAYTYFQGFLARSA